MQLNRTQKQIIPLFKKSEVKLYFAGSQFKNFENLINKLTVQQRSKMV